MPGSLGFAQSPAATPRLPLNLGNNLASGNTWNPNNKNGVNFQNGFLGFHPDTKQHTSSSNNIAEGIWSPINSQNDDQWLQKVLGNKETPKWGQSQNAITQRQNGIAARQNGEGHSQNVFQKWISSFWNKYGNNQQRYGNNQQNANNEQQYGNNEQQYGKQQQQYGNNQQQYGNNQQQQYGNNQQQQYGNNQQQQYHNNQQQQYHNNQQQYGNKQQQYYNNQQQFKNKESNKSIQENKSQNYVYNKIKQQASKQIQHYQYYPNNDNPNQYYGDKKQQYTEEENYMTAKVTDDNNHNTVSDNLAIKNTWSFQHSDSSVSSSPIHDHFEQKQESKAGNQQAWHQQNQESALQDLNINRNQPQTFANQLDWSNLDLHSNSQTLNKQQNDDGNKLDALGHGKSSSGQWINKQQMVNNGISGKDSGGQWFNKQLNGDGNNQTNHWQLQPSVQRNLLPHPAEYNTQYPNYGQKQPTQDNKYPNYGQTQKEQENNKYLNYGQQIKQDNKKYPNYGKGKQEDNKDSKTDYETHMEEFEEHMENYQEWVEEENERQEDLKKLRRYALLMIPFFIYDRPSAAYFVATELFSVYLDDLGVNEELNLIILLFIQCVDIKALTRGRFKFVEEFQINWYQELYDYGLTKAKIEDTLRLGSQMLMPQSPMPEYENKKRRKKRFAEDIH